MVTEPYWHPQLLPWPLVEVTPSRLRTAGLAWAQPGIGKLLLPAMEVGQGWKKSHGRQSNALVLSWLLGAGRG